MWRGHVLTTDLEYLQERHSGPGELIKNLAPLIAKAVE